MSAGSGRTCTTAGSGVTHRNNSKRKPAIVFDVDETLLSNYTAIDADDFTFGPQSQAEAANEIGSAVAFKLPNPFYFLP